MKVTILAFDGLEYNLVERFKLKNMKQKRYGKVAIPKVCYKEAIDPLGNRIYEPWTPFVWSSIVTGKLPSEIGLTLKNVQKWQSPLIQLFRVLSLKLRLNTRKMTRFIRGQGMKLERTGFKKGYFNLLEDSKVPTIFHHAKNPMAINVPLVHQKRTLHKDTWRLKLKGKGLSEMTKNAWREFWKIKKQTLGTIKNEEWDLLMSYVRFLDTIGELNFSRFTEMFKAYSECNTYAGEVAQLIDDKTICLIISDHGMERYGNTPFGKHSNHGFWSVNVNTKWKPTTILDLYPQIITWLAK